MYPCSELTIRTSGGAIVTAVLLFLRQWLVADKFLVRCIGYQQWVTGEEVEGIYSGKIKMDLSLKLVTAFQERTF